MNLTHTQLLLLDFNKIVQEKTESIEEKELKILYALSDLLEEQNLYEENFVSKSLEYLKTNYGLNKSVWKVLLKQYDQIPDFLEKISTRVFTEFENSTHYHKIEEYDLGYAINELQYGNSPRQYCVQKLFYLIQVVNKHFTIDQTCDYLGLFIKELDNKKCGYSMSRLYELGQNLKEEGNPMFVYDYNRFSYMFFSMNTLYRTLKSLYYRYLEFSENIEPYKKVNIKHKQNFVDGLKRNFKEINISYDDPIEKFKSIVNAYRKYTNEKFLNYKGLLEIKNKMIEKEDQENIGYLMQEFNKSERQNQVLEKSYIEITKHILSYKDNIEKGIEKREIIHDYLSSPHYIEKMFTENDFSIDKILQWSNEWHISTINMNRGEKEDFFNYNINKKIDNYIFEQIIDSHRLHEEGKSQNHCVYTYKSRCVEGKTIIVCMKDTNLKTIATLRFQKENKFNFFKKQSEWVFAENKKRFNKSCTLEEQEVANKYFLSIKNQL